MSKFFLIAGIVILALSVLSFAFAALSRYFYFNVMDGSSGLYARLERRSLASLIAGIVLLIIGAAFLVIRFTVKFP
ncbi:MAG: hypothetical protein ILO53_07275 [Clostridia bacterium]|nr:hypothetical protein [Clostridia bacterium]